MLEHLIEIGEPFDLAIIPGPLMDEQGKIVAGTSVPFVRVEWASRFARAPKPAHREALRFARASSDGERSYALTPDMGG